MAPLEPVVLLVAMAAVVQVVIQGEWARKDLLAARDSRARVVSAAPPAFVAKRETSASVVLAVTRASSGSKVPMVAVGIKASVASRALLESQGSQANVAPAV